nr:DUF2089 family protein [uncultured Carboxylicivirga sp.]
MSKNPVPINCPSCKEVLQVKQMICPACETKVEGQFAFSTLLQLPADEQELIINYFKYRGNLIKLQEVYQISYPPLRKMLDKVLMKFEGDEN